MYQIENFFAPSIGPPGLSIFVEAGVLSVSGSGIVLSATTVTLVANSTNFVYLNTSTATILTNTSGFPATNCYPIATVVTGTTGVISLVDNRPDVPGSTGGGGGGGSFSAGISGGNTSGNSGTVSNQIVFAGGNNITLSGSTNAGGMSVTVSAFNQSVQTQNVVDLSLSGNTAGVLSLISSGTAILAGGNNITLSQNGQSITISGANTVAQSNQTEGIYASSNTTGQSSSSTHDARSLTIVGQGNVSVGWSNSSFLISGTQSVQTQNAIDLSLSGNTAGILALISSGTAILAGGNNITLSQNGQSVTISAFNQSNQTDGIYASSNTTGQSSSSTYDARSLSVVGQGNVSVGWSNSSFLISGTQSVQTQNLIDISLSGNTAGVLALISSGTAILAGGNNITLSQNGQSVTISGPNTVAQSNQTLGIYASSNTTGQSSSSTYDARSLSVVGQGNVSVGWSNSSFLISGTQSVQTQNVVDVTLAGNTAGVLALISSGTLTLAGGNNITLSQAGNAVTISDRMGTQGIWWQNGPPPAINVANVTNGSWHVSPMPVEGFRSATQANFFFSISLSTSGTSNSTNNGTISASLGVFTLSVSSFISVSSSSTSFGWSFTSNNSTSVLSGMKILSLPLNITCTPGNYWVVAGFSTSTNGNLGNSISVIHSLPMSGSVFSGFLGVASNASQQMILGQGMASTFSSNLAISQLTGAAGSVQRLSPILNFVNTTF